MKITVTGGTGFIGSHVCRKLLEEGHSLTVLSHSGKWFDNQLNKRVQLICADFNDKKAVEGALQGADCLIHMGWSTVPQNSTLNPSYDIQSNLIGSVHLLDQCVKQKVSKVVFLSSGGTVYGVPKEVPITENHPLCPISSYGITKMAVEKYLYLYEKMYGLNYIILRVANAYGPGQNLLKQQGVIGTWIFKALQEESIEIWGNGEVIRDYVYVSDVVTAVSKSILEKSKNLILNIGTGSGVSLTTILTFIQNVHSKKLSIVYKPSRSFDVPSNVLDIQAAKEYLEWEPLTNIQEGIYQTYQDMKASIL